MGTGWLSDCMYLIYEIGLIQISGISIDISYCLPQSCLSSPYLPIWTGDFQGCDWRPHPRRFTPDPIRIEWQAPECTKSRSLRASQMGGCSHWSQVASDRCFPSFYIISNLSMPDHIAFGGMTRLISTQLERADPVRAMVDDWGDG